METTTSRARSRTTPFSTSRARTRWCRRPTGRASRWRVNQNGSWYEGWEGEVTADIVNLKSFEGLVAQKQLFVIAHDGDNLRGRAGSYATWYNGRAVTCANGVQCMGISEYLVGHTPPASDVVHVQDGSWVDTRDSSSDPQWHHWKLPFGIWKGQFPAFNAATGLNRAPKTNLSGLQEGMTVSFEYGGHYLERNFALRSASARAPRCKAHAPCTGVLAGATPLCRVPAMSAPRASMPGADTSKGWAGMRRMGLVDQLEAELERNISKGWLPRDRRLPSERTLAAKMGVSRSTAREALIRLQSRGLVVRHPGKLSRALPLDESLTLENLRVALHANDYAHPERQVLLGGYFVLKRNLTLDLLLACCEHASEQAMKQVSSACFMLRDMAHHEHEPLAWAWHEFELLRQAALAARRPGQLLLIRSLERAFHGMADWVLPHLDSKAIEQWATFADGALFNRDTQALRHQLPYLLEVCDKRILEALAPSCETPRNPEPPPRQQMEPLPSEALTSAPNTGDTREAAPGGAPRTPPVHAITPVPEACATHEDSHPNALRKPHEGGDEAPPETPPGAAHGGSLCLGARAGGRVDASQCQPDSAQGDPPGALCPNWSGNETRSPPAPPTGAPPPEFSQASSSGRADESRGGPLR